MSPSERRVAVALAWECLWCWAAARALGCGVAGVAVLYFFSGHWVGVVVAGLLLVPPTIYFVLAPAVLVCLAVALRLNWTSYVHTPIPCPACGRGVLITHTACGGCGVGLRYGEVILPAGDSR